jgi:hypothetical protein
LTEEITKNAPERDITVGSLGNGGSTASAGGTHASMESARFPSTGYYLHALGAHAGHIYVSPFDPKLSSASLQPFSCAPAAPLDAPGHVGCRIQLQRYGLQRGTWLLILSVELPAVQGQCDAAVLQ